MTSKILCKLVCLFKGHKPFKKNDVGFPSESYCVRCDIILGFSNKECKFFYNGNRIKYHKELLS